MSSEGGSPQSSSEVPPGTVEKRLSEAAEEATPIESQEDFERWRRGQAIARETFNLKTRRRVARWAIGLMVFQILLANVVFIVYALTKGAELDVGALQVWLGTTVVQVVAVVLVITRYLFPAPPAAPPDA